MEKRKVAIVWPGHGVQRVGMGSNIPEEILKPLFELGSEVTDLDLWEIVKEGPPDLINQTHIAQMLVTIVGLGHWEVYCRNSEINPERFPKPNMLAGHSIGELVALIASGAVNKEQAFPIIWERGSLMHKESKEVEGGMSAIIGRILEKDKISEICREIGVMVANDNSPQQVVISGPLIKLEEAKLILERLGYRCIRLPVEGAFHTTWMNGAFEGLEKVIQDVEFKKPSPPIISNLTGTFVEDPDIVKRNIPSHVIYPVRWQSISELMIKNGVTPATFLELAEHKILTRLFEQTYEWYKVKHPQIFTAQE